MEINDDHDDVLSLISIITPCLQIEGLTWTTRSVTAPVLVFITLTVAATAAIFGTWAITVTFPFVSLRPLPTCNRARGVV